MERFENCHPTNSIGKIADELTGWLGIAEAAARDAGEFLAESKASDIIVTAQLERDVKLKNDLESEKRIISVLQKSSRFSILSEESGMIENGAKNQKLRWIVDPLDGSVNYINSLPLSCVSIGLWNMDEPVLGAVYDFNHNEMFTGIVGRGSWVNGLPMKVTQTADRRRAILCTGFPVGSDFSIDAIRYFCEQIRDYKKVRLLGSAALSLCYVAAGRVDAYFERGIKIWDVAAGLAVVLGAGGRVTRLLSPQLDTLTVYANNSLLPVPCL